MPLPTPQSRLSALHGWWLSASCRCRTSHLPSVIDIARRLKCSRCGERPATLLDSDPRGSDTPGRGGYRPSVKVALTTGA